MMRYILISLSLVSILFCEDIVSGYVYDSLKQPIENVQVSIDNSSLGSITDSLGYFSLNVDLTLNNRFESYSTPEFKIFINDLLHTLAPNINSHYFKFVRTP